jgi:predicted phosphodiesterase
MIYVCGDTHGRYDLEKIKSWEKQANPGRKDYLIILGDWGAIWFGDDKDNELISYWDNKRYTVCFVDGNHENFDALEKWPIITYKGAPARLIGNHIIQLLRGYVYTIEGRTFFTFGGATSIDKYNRTEGDSWWPQEMPTREEYERGIKSLGQYDFMVDYILTHSADTDILYEISPYYEKDMTNEYLKVLKTHYPLQYIHHYFGHYHIDKQFDFKNTCLYNAVCEIERNVWYGEI